MRGVRSRLRSMSGTRDTKAAGRGHPRSRRERRAPSVAWPRLCSGTAERRRSPLPAPPVGHIGGSERLVWLHLSSYQVLVVSRLSLSIPQLWRETLGGPG